MTPESNEELAAQEPSPWSIIIQRADGLITTDEMMRILKSLHYTSHVPAPDDWDPHAAIYTPDGTIEQIGWAFDEGLLTDEEHDALVADPDLNVTTTRPPHPPDPAGAAGRDQWRAYFRSRASDTKTSEPDL